MNNRTFNEQVENRVQKRDTFLIVQKNKKIDVRLE